MMDDRKNNVQIIKSGRINTYFRKKSKLSIQFEPKTERTSVVYETRVFDYKLKRSISTKSANPLIPSNPDEKRVIYDPLSFHCETCGSPTKKIKSLQEKFKPFEPKMHQVKKVRQKLINRFRNVVYLFMWLMQRNIQKRKEQRARENQKKIFRLKTKIFEQTPVNGNFIFISNPEPKVPSPIQESSPLIKKLEAKPITLKAKQKQKTLQSYLQNRYNIYECQKTEQLLPKVHASRMIEYKKSRLSQNEMHTFASMRSESPKLKKSSVCSPYFKLPSSLASVNSQVEVRSQAVSPLKSSPRKNSAQKPLNHYYFQKQHFMRMKKISS